MKNNSFQLRDTIDVIADFSEEIDCVLLLETNENWEQELLKHTKIKKNFPYIQLLVSQKHRLLDIKAKAAQPNNSRHRKTTSVAERADTQLQKHL